MYWSDNFLLNPKFAKVDKKAEGLTVASPLSLLREILFFSLFSESCAGSEPGVCEKQRTSDLDFILMEGAENYW